MLSKNLASKKRSSEDAGAALGSTSRRESTMQVGEQPHHSPPFAALVHKTMKQHPTKHSSNNVLVQIATDPHV